MRLASAVEPWTSATLARRALQPILRAADPHPPDAPPAAPEQRDDAGSSRPDRPTIPAPLSDDTEGALHVRGLSVQRAGRRVLRDINLDLQPGDRAILAGASGTGRSTLATALTGLVAHSTAASPSTSSKMPRPSAPNSGSARCQVLDVARRRSRALILILILITQQ